jgi:hypothetical protein
VHRGASTYIVYFNLPQVVWFTKRHWSCYQSPELDIEMLKGFMATTFFTEEISPGNPDSKI